MGACKEKKKRKRATKALDLACEILVENGFCPHIGTTDCDDKCHRCWKVHLYNEVDNDKHKDIQSE